MRHLKAFHVFDVSASCSSFSEAAQQLNITHGAVSKQIKTLETYLGVELFYKKGRNVYLTTQGEKLKVATRQAFSVLEASVHELRQFQTQALEVSCEPTLTMRWLMPRLADFYEKSGIDVRLSTAGGAIELGMSGLSLAIRRDDFKCHRDYHKTPLVAEWVGPVFSPEYWDKVKHDHQDITFIHSATRPTAWQSWQDKIHHCLDIKGKHQQTFGHFYFCIQAAIDGLGAAMGSYPFVMDDIKRGVLVAPFGFVPSGCDYMLMSTKAELEGAEALFSTWLTEHLSQAIPTSDEQEK
ncbi:LysR family transcriptional regulator [Photobacterium lucens]|uniref:LysR family transcriptional regulator n=1 Tax=Photobacterium lucens TaxID=2562949 RepID=UPI00136F9942|nr:LysR family transcriptional regulator [Photobacterium lucens]MBP2699843.1 LysR family transcriptional regulator [Vibrio parahaemolyticus]MZG55382.1 LysR family transcriptional regulator [Photobacterium lucens]MZG80678.1 LysR family transcriptional regulator [Photobacterium lucens]